VPKRLFEIQTVSRPFGPAEKIPPALWRTVARASTQTGAYRAYARYYRWYHPQQGAWSGHVRVRYDGQTCVVDQYTHLIYLYDPIRGIETALAGD
jgi:hypothetical protein